MDMRNFTRKVAAEVKDKILGRLRVHAAYRRLFATPDGKIVLQHLIKVAHVKSSTFVAGDPHRTSLNEGKRLLALSILSYTHKDTSQLMAEMEQAQNENSNTIQ